MPLPTLVCLHGWGGSKESFTELREVLAGSGLTILTPDLPGFGSEHEPDHPWTCEDYADWTQKWIHDHVPADAPLHLLGHSHGGRIAITLAASNRLPLEHLYLCASAGIRHPKHIRRTAGLLLAKCGAAMLSIPGLRSLAPIGKKTLYKLLGVHDYERASPIMKDTLRAVSAEDLRRLLPLISVPTDIFWGTKDSMTPVSDGTLMHKAIAGSTLHLYEGIGHRVHRDRATEIAAIIRNRCDLKPA